MTMNRREFGKLVGGVPTAGNMLAAFTGRPTVSEVDSGRRPWYETNRRWTTFNAHFQAWDPEIASRLNSTEVMRNVVASHANVFMMFAVDGEGYAYYPSRTACVHPNLKDGNLLRNIVRECKQHGIAVVFYCCVSQSAHLGQRHPEWLMRDSENRTVAFDSVQGPLLCYNSGYLGYVKALAEEMLAYDPDGLFFDMLWFGESGTVCYCQENCQPLFRKRYGAEMPLRPSWDDSWRNFLEFRYESNERFAHELTATARRLRSDISIGFNYHGQPPFSWQVGMQPVRHRLISDYATGEALPNWLGHWYPSFLTTYVRGLKPGSPTMMATSRCCRTYTDYTLRPEADLRWEAFTYLSHGAHLFLIDDALYDGRLQSQVYDRMGRLFEEIEKKEPYFGYPHLHEVGLYYSAKTRDWYAREQPSRYENAIIGAHRAMAESHIAVDILFDEDVTLDRLKQYPVIVLPNVAILDDNEVRLFEAYVQGGGALIATQDTGLYDENGRVLSRCVLERVLGIRYKSQTAFRNCFFRLPQGPLANGVLPDWDILVTGTANVVEISGGEAVGELRIPFYDGPPFHPIGIAPHNSPWKAVGPAVVLNQYGQGRTAYIACGPDAAYVGDYAIPEHRLVLRNIVRHLHSRREISIEAPLAVEAVATHDVTGRRYLIHFIGYQGARVVGGMRLPVRPSTIEEQPLYRARVSLTQAPRSVHAASPTTVIELLGNSVSLQIEEIHETMIVSY